MDDLFRGPTPVETLPSLGAALGLAPGDLLIKRDDLIGLGGGGNKVRKLQFSCQSALDEEATVLVTTGAPQSNHARLTAAAGARLGLRVVLVLGGDRPESARGNVLLDELFGAELVWAHAEAPEARADRVMADLAAQGARAYRIPFGGSSPHTARAYEVAGRELLAQVPGLDHVVVAVGSGGTMAGLVAALGTSRVLGVDSGATPSGTDTVSGLLRAMGASAEGLRIDERHIGRGYEHLEPETLDAMRLVARTEGIVLDPTYTGRAAAGLIAAVKSGAIRPGERTVFLHTGGLPGLFGHPEM